MTVSVNPVSRPASDNDTLMTAVQLALKFYDIKMNKDQQEAATRIKVQKEEKDQAIDFQGKYEPVTERPKFGPFIAKDQAPSLAQQNAPEGSVGFVPTSFGQKERELNIQSDNLAFQRGEKQKERIADLQKEFDQKPKIKESVDKLSTAQYVDSLIDVNNPVSLNIAKAQVARIANGVGVLSDKDVERVGGSQDVVSNAKRIANKWSTGQPLLPEDVQDLKEVTAVFKASAQKDIEREAQRFSEQKSSYVNLTKQQIINQLGLDSYLNSPMSQQLSQGGAPTQAPGDGGGQPNPDRQKAIVEEMKRRGLIPSTAGQ